MSARLIGCPKSGNNWLKFMLNKYYKNEDVNEINPYTSKYKWTHDGSAIYYGRRESKTKSFFEEKNKKKYRGDRIILLIRDPRDVIVSLYHHMINRKSKDFKFGNLSNFIRDDVCGFNRILFFYDLWKKSLDDPKEIMIVSYEDLKNNGIKTLSKIISFIDKPADEERVKRIYEKSEFSKMKELERNGKISGLRKSKQNEDAMIVRKGKIGGYVDYMNEDDIEYCNNLMKEIKPIYNSYF